MSREVLIIDDDPNLLRLLEAHLRTAGHPVRKAASGSEALASVRADPVRIALVDYDMPGMTGVEFCRAVRADKNIPFTHLIVLTAHAERCLMIEALDAGADDFLAKPFDREELLARLRAAERTVQLQDELEASLRTEAERNHLRQAVAAMEHVLGVVGHELRTPLAGMRAMSEFLMCDGAQQLPEWNTFIGKIHDETVRMSETVNNLLEAARLNSGKARWNWSTFSLAEVVEAALDGVRPLIKDLPVTLDSRVDPPELSMQGDSDAIRRLIVNLLANSSKHTPRGTISVEIGAKARAPAVAGPGPGPGPGGGTAGPDDLAADGRVIEIRVRDTGGGIAPDVVLQLGEAFALNSGMVGANKVHGTGLGLAICKSITAAHGGELRMDSTLGEGTTVIVTLRADLSEPVIAPPAPAGAIAGTAWACDAA